MLLILYCHLAVSFDFVNNAGHACWQNPTFSAAVTNAMNAAVTDG